MAYSNSNLPAETANTNDLNEIVNTHREEISSRVDRYLRENWSFLERYVTRRDLVKMVQDEKLKAAETELEFRRRVLELFSNSRLEAIEEKLEGQLRQYRAEIRAELTEMVVQKRVELQETATSEINAFVDEMSALYDKADDFERDDRAGRLREAVQKQEKQFFRWVGELVEEFEDSIERRISDYS
jgi:hypothetical protein